MKKAAEVEVQKTDFTTNEVTRLEIPLLQLNPLAELDLKEVTLPPPVKKVVALEAEVTTTSPDEPKAESLSNKEVVSSEEEGECGS